MVRVRQSLLCNVPGLVPIEVRVVEENSHQLGNRHCRVCIVELDGGLFRKRVPVGIVASEAAYDIGQRAGDQEVLLQKAQTLPQAGGVVGIKDSGEGLGLERLGDGSDEVTVAERRKVKVIRRVRSPETKRIDGFAAVTNYRPIKGNTYQTGRFASDRTQSSSPHFKGTVQFDFDLLMGSLDLPRVLPAEPVVRLFLLPAIPNGLLEDAVFIAKAVANGRELHGRHGVEEASSQTPESTVTEAGVGFLLEQP